MQNLKQMKNHEQHYCTTWTAILFIQKIRNEDKPGRQWQYCTHIMYGHSLHPQHRKHLLHHSSAKVYNSQFNLVTHSYNFPLLLVKNFQYHVKVHCQEVRHHIPCWFITGSNKINKRSWMLFASFRLNWDGREVIL